MNSVYLRSRARLAINKKNQKYFSLLDHQLAKDLILILWFLRKDKTGYKRICNWICRNYICGYFHITISLKLLAKSLLRNIFSLITWNTKPLAKQLVESPQQILINYVHIGWRAFQLLWLFFETFRISWFVWQNIFDHF